MAVAVAVAEMAQAKGAGHPVPVPVPVVPDLLVVGQGQEAAAQVLVLTFHLQVEVEVEDRQQARQTTDSLTPHLLAQPAQCRATAAAGASQHTCLSSSWSNLSCRLSLRLKSICLRIP